MKSLPKNSIFLAGGPATGKTYFGNWLETHHVYIHLDIEKDDSVKKYNLQNEINQFWKGNYKALFDKLFGFKKPIVLNYGFPPEALPYVQKFLEFGLFPVWFEANSKIAREKFIERGNISVRAYDIQVGKIENNREKIFQVFGNCMIRTLLDDGTRVSPEDIFKHINERILKHD